MIGEIKNIQRDDVNHDATEIRGEREVGLALGIRAKNGCELIRFT